MIENVPGIVQREVPLVGGVDEVSPVTRLKPEDYLTMENWRLTKDGTRIEKRAGLSEEVTNFGEDVYGYSTYYDADSVFCELAILESRIMRKVTGGSWAAIHTFSGNIAHPSSVLEIHGKQFIINEVDSRFIHINKADYQIGITAPATLPTLTASSGGAFEVGTYRYAVTYARSGNFGNESNPIKSYVAAAAITGAGLDDLTAGGSYSGSGNITIRVQIDATGTPDTVKISYDGGTTWHTTGVPIPATLTISFSYGATGTFGATTGHTLNDYWDIACSACSITATANQKVTLTSIPVSSDAQVNQRKIYRTTADGATFYWLATISDNTTTTYVDNLEDGALGSEASEDRDVLPNGKFAAWWDNRLWVSGTNIAYYSAIDEPEAFDTDSRYVLVRKGEKGDEITGMVDYKDALYVFKRNSITVIQKRADGGYGADLFNSDFGCIAPYSIVEVNNLLMFLTYRGWEVYNGLDTYEMSFSIKLDTTLSLIDHTKLDLISSVHVKERNEVWLSIPDRTGGNAACTPVYNYLNNKFYVFKFYKIPSCLIACRNSSKALVNKMGTRDGYLCLCESGTRDGTTNISASARKGWHNLAKTSDIRRMDLEYEIPAAKAITVNFYYDFDKDVQRTDTVTGETLSATNIDIRRPHQDHIELGGRGKYLSIEFKSTDNPGGAVKINEMILYHKPRAIKGKKHGD